MNQNSSMLKSLQRLKAKGVHVISTDTLQSTQATLVEYVTTHPHTGWALVHTHEQTKGVGQYQRHWHSRRGDLTFSVALPLANFNLSTLPLNLGFFIASSLEDPAHPVWVKWPNDLVYASPQGLSKLGGLLCQRAANHVVIGVGINLTPKDDPLTSTLNAKLSLDQVLQRCVEAVQTSVSTPFLAEHFAQKDALFDRQVEVTDPMSGALLCTGAAKGVLADGALQIQTKQGLKRCYTGRVRLISQKAPAS